MTTLIGSTPATWDGGAYTLTATNALSPIAGDTLIFVLLRGPLGTTTPPAGFLQLTSDAFTFTLPGLNSRTYVFETWAKDATGGEPGSWVFGLGTNDTAFAGIMYVYRGLKAMAGTVGNLLRSYTHSTFAGAGDGLTTLASTGLTVTNDTSSDLYLTTVWAQTFANVSVDSGAMSTHGVVGVTGNDESWDTYLLDKFGPAGAVSPMTVRWDQDFGGPSSVAALLSMSLAGLAPVAGTLAKTLGALTITATGTVAVAGTLTKALGAVTSSAFGGGGRFGTLTATLAGATLVAAGITGIGATAAVTLGALALVAAGTVTISGALTKTLGALTSAPALTASGVWATATHKVRVVLTTEPKHADMFDPGDALNPRTWAVTRLDTGDPVPVIAVVMGADDPTNHTVDLTLLEPLSTHLVSHELEIIGLLTLGGAPMTGGSTFNFLGLVQTMDPIELATIDVFRDRDLANPPFQIDRGIGYSGTIVIGADGDYDTDAGLPLLRKCLMRRMGTKRGSIRHLPRYGIGLLEKEPIGSAGDVVRLRTEIEDQAMQEPDTQSAQARLSINRQGVLVVQLFVRAKNGLSLNIRMGAAGGRLVEL